LGNVAEDGITVARVHLRKNNSTAKKCNREFAMKNINNHILYK